MEERNCERDSGENPMLAGLPGFESIFGVLSERWEVKIRIGTIYTQTNQQFINWRRGLSPGKQSGRKQRKESSA
jgi:hypothetical protein